MMERGIRGGEVCYDIDVEKVRITIIGAGVVGLAIAAELSKENKEVVLLEKESSFGQGTSSRNSEIVHAGIYYPKDSLKAKLCVEGKKFLYDFCAANRIPYARIGKMIWHGSSIANSTGVPS